MLSPITYLCTWMADSSKIRTFIASNKTPKSSLTHVVDEVSLRFIRRRRRDRISIAFVGAERLGVAPPLAGRGNAIGLCRHHVPEGVVQVAIQQAALVLGRRGGAVVTVGAVGHGVDAALFLEGGWPAKVWLADMCLRGTLLVWKNGNRTVTKNRWDVHKVWLTEADLNPSVGLFGEWWTKAATVWVGVITAHAQPLSVSLDVFVVQFDPQGPAQVWLPHCVLQPSPGIREPVGNLRRHNRGLGQQYLSKGSNSNSNSSSFCLVWSRLTCTSVMCEPRASRTFSVLVG